jgi:hypothetical protein
MREILDITPNGNAVYYPFDDLDEHHLMLDAVPTSRLFPADLYKGKRIWGIREGTKIKQIPENDYEKLADPAAYDDTPSFKEFRVIINWYKELHTTTEEAVSPDQAKLKAGFRLAQKLRVKPAVVFNYMKTPHVVSVTQI